MNPILQEALGSIFRWGLAIGAGYLVRAGIWTQEDASGYVAAAALALVALGWSLYQKYANRQKIVTALSLTSPMTEAQLEHRIANGVAASVATPKSETPRTGSGSSGSTGSGFGGGSVSMFIAAIVLGSMSIAACGGNPSPNLPSSPEGKIAFYGVTVMKGVESAQNAIIAWADASGNRKVAEPAVRVFVEVGKRGVDLATVLEAIDKTNVTAEKQELAARARNIIAVITTSLTSVAVDLGDAAARKRVADAITQFVNSPLYALIEALAPLVPKVGGTPPAAIEPQAFRFERPVLLAA